MTDCSSVADRHASQRRGPAQQPPSATRDGQGAHVGAIAQREQHGAARAATARFGRREGAVHAACMAEDQYRAKTYTGAASTTADLVAGFATGRRARRRRRAETTRSVRVRYRRAGKRKAEARGAGMSARRGSRPSHRCDAHQRHPASLPAVPGHNPGGGKACIARYNPRDASAATANSQRGPNRNGRTTNPASAHSVRISPFPIGKGE